MAQKKIVAEANGKRYEIVMDVPDGAGQGDIESAVSDWVKSQGKVLGKAEASAAPDKTPQSGFLESAWNASVGGAASNLKDYFTKGPPAGRGLKNAARAMELYRKDKLSPEEEQELQSLEGEGLPTPGDQGFPLAEHPVSAPAALATQQFSEGNPSGAAGTLFGGYGVNAALAKAGTSEAAAKAARATGEGVKAGVKASVSPVQYGMHKLPVPGAVAGAMAGKFAGGIFGPEGATIGGVAGAVTPGLMAAWNAVKEVYRPTKAVVEKPTAPPPRLQGSSLARQQAAEAASAKPRASAPPVQGSSLARQQAAEAEGRISGTPDPAKAQKAAEKLAARNISSEDLKQLPQETKDQLAKDAGMTREEFSATEKALYEIDLQGQKTHYGDTGKSFGDRMVKHASDKDATLIKHFESKGITPQQWETANEAQRNVWLRQANQELGKKYDPYSGPQGANSAARLHKTWTGEQPAPTASGPKSAPSTVESNAAKIHDFIKRSEPNGTPISTQRLREAFPGMSKAEFDAAAKHLSKQQKVFLSQQHSNALLDPEQVETLVDGQHGAIGLRNP
jgi:hypothetical protein